MMTTKEVEKARSEIEKDMRKADKDSTPQNAQQLSMAAIVRATNANTRAVLLLLDKLDK